MEKAAARATAGAPGGTERRRSGRRARNTRPAWRPADKGGGPGAAGRRRPEEQRLRAPGRPVPGLLPGGVRGGAGPGAERLQNA